MATKRHQKARKLFVSARTCLRLISNSRWGSRRATTSAALVLNACHSREIQPKASRGRVQRFFSATSDFTTEPQRARRKTLLLQFAQMGADDGNLVMLRHLRKSAFICGSSSALFKIPVFLPRRRVVCAPSLAAASSSSKMDVWSTAVLGTFTQGMATKRHEGAQRKSFCDCSCLFEAEFKLSVGISASTRRRN